MKLKIIRAILDTPPEVDRQIMDLINRKPKRIDGRDHPRIKIDMPATINGNPARTVDICEGGVKLAAQTYLEMGQFVHVELYAGSETIGFQGEIRHVKGDKLGIRAVALEDGQKLQLKNLTP